MSVAPVPDWQRYRPMTVVARLFGITEGQAVTAFGVLAIAVVLSVAGLVPVLRHRLDPSGPPAVAGPQSGGAAPSSSVSPAAAPVPAGDSASGPVAASGPASLPAISSAPRRTAAPPRALSTSGAGASAVTSPTAASPRLFPTPTVGSIALFATVPSPGAPGPAAVAADGTVYVATDNGATGGESGVSVILSYAASGAPRRVYSITGQRPGHQVGIRGLALDGRGGIVAVDGDSGRVIRIDLASAAQRDYSALLDLPSCMLVVSNSNCEPGVQDHKPGPGGAVLDSAGNLYVTDGAQATIWRIPASGGPPSIWYQAVDLATGDGLSGIAVDPHGSVLVSSPASLDANASGGGAVYRIEVKADGTAGQRALIAALHRGDEPAGVVPTRDGSTVVALAGANSVVLFGTDGSERRRLSAGTSDIPLDAPTGLALQGSTLLVTNRAPGTRAHWAVLAAGIL